MSRKECEIQAAEIILQSGAEGTIDALVRLEGLIADAIVQARSQAYEELEAALTAKKYLPSQGIDAEMEAFNDGLDEAISIVLEAKDAGLKNG